MPDRRPPVDVKAVGERLKELRGDRSLAEVAGSIRAHQEYKIDPSTIGSAEKGEAENPGARTLDVLAREYARVHGPWVTVEYLLYGVKDRPRRAAK